MAMSRKHLPHKEEPMEKIVYVTIPVRFVDDEPSIHLEDDGEPGPWGDTWVYDDDLADGGYWTFGGDLSSKAWSFIVDRLAGADR